MRSVMTLINRARQSLAILSALPETLDAIKINQGRMLAEFNRGKTSRQLQDYEFKIFSQWGEDGILQRLTQVVPMRNRTFIEFGVEDFFESNCRFLLMKDDWQGFVIDGSERHIAKLKNASFYWQHQLEAQHAFITRENINVLLDGSGFERDLGILSIDLDGNDYHVLEAIDRFEPRILVCEYNPVFGAERKISVPYQPDFQRTAAHYSNLYWGASLSAMTYLAEKRGYVLVGTTTARYNAFYVRRELVDERCLEILSAEEAYVASFARESRDQGGKLSHLSGDARLTAIRGLPVIDVETGQAAFV